MFSIDKYTNHKNNIFLVAMEVYRFITSAKINPEKMSYNQIGTILSDKMLNKKFDLLILIQSIRLLFVLKYINIEMENINVSE